MCALWTHQSHVSKDCRFKNAVCHLCGKQGHIKPVCKSNPTAKFVEEIVSTVSSNESQNPNVTDDVGLGMFNITTANTSKCEPWALLKCL